MQTALDPRVANGYHSESQRSRVITEGWVDREAYCPSCGGDLDQFESNSPVADFQCKKCREEFELKSKKNHFGSTIVDGAYGTMIERLKSDTNPSLLLLTYQPRALGIIDFFVIPKYFFIPKIIERRKPLASTARRAGWVGCNIRLGGVPEAGKIHYIKNGKVLEKTKVVAAWKRTNFLDSQRDVESKGWLLDIMRCLDRITRNEFSLDDVYRFHDELQLLHPGNRHVKDKIRQQLQILRDKGFLRFISRGMYFKNH